MFPLSDVDSNPNETAAVAAACHAGAELLPRSQKPDHGSPFYGTGLRLNTRGAEPRVCGTRVKDLQQ